MSDLRHSEFSFLFVRPPSANGKAKRKIGVDNYCNTLLINSSWISKQEGMKLVTYLPRVSGVS